MLVNLTALFLFAAALVLAAPTLDQTTLLHNGQAAQALNKQFQTLKSTDACSDGQTACIGKDKAQCTNGTWTTSKCAVQQCFALPSVKTNGTVLACTSASDVASLIAATGASGGLFGNSTSAASKPPAAIRTATESGTLTSHTVPSISLSVGLNTITVDAQDASAILASITAHGGSVETIIHDNAVATATP